MIRFSETRNHRMVCSNSGRNPAYLGRYPDPLGFGKTPSRFSDPRWRVATNRFGVLYLGDTVKVCFLEALLRDQRDGAIGDLPMEEAELHDRHYAEIEITVPLKMIDLRDDGPIAMGVPTDVAKAELALLDVYATFLSLTGKDLYDGVPLWGSW